MEDYLSANQGRLGTVKPFREVNAPHVHHPTNDEVVRLVSAVDADLHQIVMARMLTGVRHHEITRLRATACGKSNQFRPLREAWAAARIEPAISF